LVYSFPSLSYKIAVADQRFEYIGPPTKQSTQDGENGGSLFIFDATPGRRADG
jgi:hypothetical protein